MLNLEDKLISLVARYLQVTNTLHESPLSLQTDIIFKDKTVYSHNLDLEPLVPIIKSRLQEE